MKKFLPYIVFAVVLAAALVYFTYTFAPSTLEKKESDFAFKNIDDITEIKLSDNAGKKVYLTQNKDGEWLLDGQYEVNEQALGLLLEAVTKVQVLSPVAQNGINNVVRDLVKEHQKIEIFTGKNNLAKSYYVGGGTLNGLGTYMLMEVNGGTAKKPYITYIPSVRAFLTARYDADILHWRSVWVYRQNRNTIQSVSVTYHNIDSLQSFSIKKNKEDKFVFFDAKNKLVPQQPKQLRLEQYLDFFSDLSIEAYKNDYDGKDSILKKGPFCTVAVTDINDKTKTVELYRVPISNLSVARTDPNGRPLKYDIEYFYILFNDRKDFAVAQYYVWAKALRSYDEFLQQNAKPILNNNR